MELGETSPTDVARPCNAVAPFVTALRINLSHRNDDATG